MVKNFVTFGSNHTCNVGDKELNYRNVATYESENWEIGRRMAFAVFGARFSFHQTDEMKDWKDGGDNMVRNFFPDGLVDISEEIQQGLISDKKPKE